MLNPKTSIKYLGVLADESLNSNSHVKYLKLSFASNMIQSIKFETLYQLVSQKLSITVSCIAITNIAFFLWDSLWFCVQPRIMHMLGALSHSFMLKMSLNRFVQVTGFSKNKGYISIRTIEINAQISQQYITTIAQLLSNKYWNSFQPHNVICKPKLLYA